MTLRHKIVFAWFPITIWHMSTNGIRKKSKKVWLKRVVLTETMFDGWIAFKHHQKAKNV